jgi:hypothetical protein
MDEISDTTATRIEIAASALERGNRALALGVLLNIPVREQAVAMALLRRYGFDPATLLAPAPA